MSRTVVADLVSLDLERLVRIDRRIDERESSALRDRWEFGRAMLAARDGKGRLPNGYLAALVERTGKSQSELSDRQKFAAICATELELLDAIQKFGSWYGVCRALVRANDQQITGVEPPPVLPVADGQYATVVADPPWQYTNTSTRGAAENHYPTMSIAELCDLPIARDAAAPQAHLYLWTTAGHLPDAFTVMTAWGFTYKTYLVWVKPQMGMGNYFRVSTEMVLFGIRGTMRTRDRALMNYFDAPRGKHSAKPGVFYDLVAAASPGPYLEMFARCQADELLTGCACSACSRGWTTWGNQAQVVS